eukprot:CAMPEP_0204636716 /NCGR_PEP_ID=MMETSP0717-20131115/34678_1 /ASSEMBLY_ACC=CAM_ASM_000666 /TAXON_ID=230516 /ORGANISM="Chaetoceros curvisetus" /LENGTH=120 /DNA_ID=CAMNT_0051655849 /DNA_START=102 /DNA_END=460 /DNA_ORIENTATION=+
MTANTALRCGFSNNACRMGIVNAPVLPDPVSARPMMSLPSNACGSVSFWIRLACVQLSDDAALQISSMTPRDSNVCFEIMASSSSSSLSDCPSASTTGSSMDTFSSSSFCTLGSSPSSSL